MHKWCEAAVVLPEWVPGVDLNGCLVDFPGAMGAHGTMVNSGSAMVLEICYGCHERGFPYDGSSIVLDFRQHQNDEKQESIDNIKR